ncbi:transposase [Marinomonas sp. 2405UD68-3]|uniref:transposase n=1 Tax=Marinomonas sp. 2405UD68-3 TaxID=3391835 RepID=UPI0039C90E45
MRCATQGTRPFSYSKTRSTFRTVIGLSIYVLEGIAFLGFIATGFEVEITEFNGESDHIHLLIYHRPKGRCFTCWMVKPLMFLCG